MILWFRSDLRCHDNPAIQRALELGVKQAFFIATPKQWQEHHLSAIKIDLILRHVELLKEQLITYGIALTLIEVDDYNEQVKWLKNYCDKNNVEHIIANRELEINECKRDDKLQKLGITLTLFECDVIVPKGKILNKSGDMFKVFTPFKKAWLNYIKDIGFEYIEKAQMSQYAVQYINHVDTEQTRCITTSSQWPLANTVEADIIPNFLSYKIADYATDRDIPSIKGTSGLSAYLAIGAISSRYLLRLLINRYPDILSAQPEAEFTWLNELIWREFYRHLMFSFPDICKGQNFHKKYDALIWSNNSAHFLAWQQGKTGYPIVDAAMLQLKKTGWMHNRLRMIVASFLTKHLLIDWRLGESYFMENLIDGDLAANNGGWQWSAGTGCDAQPYFRIFNPITQSKKFDPDGYFIRKYIPELSDVPNKFIHFPHDYLIDKKHDYWPAIVEHKAAREKALSTYQAALNR